MAILARLVDCLAGTRRCDVEGGGKGMPVKDSIIQVSAMEQRWPRCLKPLESISPIGIVLHMLEEPRLHLESLSYHLATVTPLVLCKVHICTS